MSTAEQRRRRLGKAAVDAAHQAAQAAPAPGQALFDSLAVLLAGHSRAADTGRGDVESSTPRDAA